MSFDLYVLDLDDTPDAAAVHALLDDRVDDAGTGGRRGGGVEVLTDSLQALVVELETRFPILDDDPDGSLWASWPLGQPVAGGRGNAFNLSWSSAETATEALLEAAARHGLLIFDAQSDLLVPPSDVRVGGAGQHRTHDRKRWWRRS